MESIIILAQSNGGGALVGGAVIFIVIALIASVFWIWALIDCLTSSMPTNEKVLWALVIFFLHLLGAILYFAIARKGRGRTVT
jgi:hypothetical protein